MWAGLRLTVITSICLTSFFCLITLLILFLEQFWKSEVCEGHLHFVVGMDKKGWEKLRGCRVFQQVSDHQRLEVSSPLWSEHYFHSIALCLPLLYYLGGEYHQMLPWFQNRRQSKEGFVSKVSPGFKSYILPLPGWITLGKWFNLFDPQVFHL